MGVPRKVGLYRRLMALYVKRGLERKLLLNLSAGAGEFKELRGALGTVEYDVVYDGHLGIHRRMPWRVLGRIFTETRVRKFER